MRVRIYIPTLKIPACAVCMIKDYSIHETSESLTLSVVCVAGQHTYSTCTAPSETQLAHFANRRLPLITLRTEYGAQARLAGEQRRAKSGLISSWFLFHPADYTTASAPPLENVLNQQEKSR